MGSVATHASVSVSGKRKIVATIASGRRVICMAASATDLAASQGASLRGCMAEAGITISRACIASRMSIICTPVGIMGARGVNAEAGQKHSPTSTPSLAGHGGTPRATFEHWHLMGS